MQQCARKLFAEEGEAKLGGKEHGDMTNSNNVCVCVLVILFLTFFLFPFLCGLVCKWMHVDLTGRLVSPRAREALGPCRFASSAAHNWPAQKQFFLDWTGDDSYLIPINLFPWQFTFDGGREAQPSVLVGESPPTSYGTVHFARWRPLNAQPGL